MHADTPLTRRHLLGWAALTSLSACGGGGGDDGGSGTAITLQPNWDATVVSSEYFRFVYLLPSTAATPLRPGTHYLLALGYKASNSIASGPQTLAIRALNLSQSLPVASFDGPPVEPDHYLKGGRIHRISVLSRIVTRAEGETLVVDNFADDGSTLLYSVAYTSWGSPIPLSGPMSANSELLQQEFVLRQGNDTPRYDLGRDWAVGASYFRRRSKAVDERIAVFDSNGTSYGASPSPVNTSATSIEAFFGSPAVVNAGGWTNDNVKYTLDDGSISTVEGVRTWVARQPRPRSAAPTPQYLCFIELNGSLYRGGLIRANTPASFANGVDATTPRDDEFRYNLQAVESVRAALKF